MKKRLTFFVILSLLICSKHLFAQCGNLPPQINFTNGSFEDTPISPGPPSGWETDPGITPDVQPILIPSDQ
jgi:hypothetical protein